MTTKQYLRQLRRLQTNIEILTREIEERRTRLEAPAAPKLTEKVQSSTPGDSFASAIAAIADKDIRRKALVYEYEAKRDRIVEQILRLQAPEIERLILYAHYVQGESLRTIAEKNAYSYDWICHMHGRALAQFGAENEHDILKQVFM